MKRLILYVLVLLFATPLLVFGATAASWFTPSPTATYITPNNINGVAQGLIVNASSTLTSTLRLSSLSNGGLAVFNGLVSSGATTTAGTGLTYSANSFNVNTSQNISTLSNLTSNGFVKTSGGTGALSIDTNTYLTGNQTITLSGDVSGSGSTAITTTIGALKVLGSMIANATIDLTTKVTGVLPIANGGTASSTALGGILAGNGSSAIKSAIIGSGLSWDGSTLTATGGSGAAYPFALTGNATSTLTQFNGGLTAYASSTIGNGTGASGLTINGTATTTTLCLTGDVCRTTWPTGSGSPFPFTAQSYGVSTSTTVAFTNGLLGTASSTFTSSLTLSSIKASSGNFCLQIDANGTLSNTGSACGSGTSIPFPFTAQSYGVSTSTTVGFLNGLFSTASTTFSSGFISMASSTLQNFTAINATTSQATTTALNVSGTLTGAGLSTCTGTNALTWSGGQFSCTAQPQGTVTAVSVASANGFAGSSSGGATPALTISTSITGVLKGNGTAISAAANGTDYTLLSAQTCSAGQHISALTAAGGSTCTNDTFPFTAQTWGVSTSTTVGFTNGFLATASSTFTSTFTLSNIKASSGNFCLQVDTAGVVTNTGSACGSGGGSAFPFTTTTFGATTANATSTLTGFTAGLYALASSTVGNGTATGGLTIAGGATTTGNHYISGSVGVGTTTPGSIFSIQGVANFVASGISTIYNALTVVGNMVVQGSLSLSGLSNGCLNITGGVVGSTGTACGTGGSGRTLNASMEIPFSDCFPEATTTRFSVGGAFFQPAPFNFTSGAMTFGYATSSAFNCIVHLPTDYSSGLTLNLVYMSTSTSGIGVVDIEATSTSNRMQYGNPVGFTPILNASTTASNRVTIPSAAGVGTTSSPSLSSITGLVAGNDLLIRLTRYGVNANDTMGADLLVPKLWLTYTSQ